MASYMQKTIDALLETEDELKAFLEKAASLAGKPIAGSKLALEAKNSVGRAILAIPTGDTSLTDSRKALAPIVNILAGIVDGLSSKTLAKSDYLQTLKNLKNKFVPPYRKSIDDLQRKIKDRNLDISGSVFETEKQIVVAFNQILTEVERISKSWTAGATESADTQRLVIDKRIDFVKERLVKIPQSKQLDDALLEACKVVDRLKIIYDELDSNASFKVEDLNSLTFHLGLLEDEIQKIQKSIKNGIFHFSNSLRKTLPLGMESDKVSGKEKKRAAQEIARTPDEHLRERLKEIKAGKKNLPANLKTPYQLLDSAIVVIFKAQDTVSKKDRPMGPGTVAKNFTREKLLEQHGIKYIKLDDYLILESQKLLAIDKAKLRKKVVLYNKTSKKKLKINADLFLTYAREVLDKINERSSTTWVMASQESVSNIRNIEIGLYWIMPAKVLNALMSRGWNKIGSWNLPYDASGPSDY